MLKQYSLPPSRQKDPTKTLVLRTRFGQDASGRLLKLKSAIRKYIIAEDYFNLKGQHGFNPKSPVIVLAKKKFEYHHTDRKINDFMAWLKTQYNQGILEVTPSLTRSGKVQNQPWSNLYIRSAYQSGLAQGRKDAIARGIKIPSFRPQGPGSISGVMNQPFHADRAALMYTRVFNQLKGVTTQLDKEFSHILSMGMSEGIGPHEMARRLNDRVQKITKKELPKAHPKGPSGVTRARLIARTETIRTHNVSAINEFERVEAETGQKVYVEWSATMDRRTRPEHARRNGQVYEREVAMGMIGEPNCRCSLLPWIQAIHGKDKKLPNINPSDRGLKRKYDVVDKKGKLVEVKRRKGYSRTKETTTDAITYSTKRSDKT